MARRVDLDEYSGVAERIRAFYERHPEGAIQTEMVRLEGDLAVFRALVYRDPEDPHPTTGWAYERSGSGDARRTAADPEAGRTDPAGAEPRRPAGETRRPATRTGVLNFVEHCETAAVGRALANLNFAGDRRPSREEMEKVMRMRAAEAAGVERGGRGGGGGRGRHGGRERRDAGGADGERGAPGAGRGRDRASRRRGAAPPDVPTVERVRALLGTASLPADRLARIEARLSAGPNARQLGEMEAYLLALQPRRPGRKRDRPARGRAATGD